MDVSILIQRLQHGESVTRTTPEGQVYVERLPPTSTALQAARALQSLVQLHEGNMRVINQLNQDVLSLNEQLQLLQSNNTSGQTSGESEPVADNVQPGS